MKLARAPDDPLPLLHPNMAELYRWKIAALTKLLQAPETRDEAFEIIRSMIDEARLVPKGGNPRFGLTGELAGILSLCEESKKPGHDGQAHAGQIKLVAGARYQRCLHLDYACL